MLYVAVLADRELFSPEVIRNFARAIPTEFAVVHASGFLAWPWVAKWDRKKRGLFVAALAGLYTLPLAIFALATGGIWPLAIFWGLMLNRMLAVVVGDLPDDNAFTAWAMAWAGTTTLYVVCVIIGVFGGTTDTTKALVMGFLYFTLVGLSELTHWAWVHRWAANARKRSRVKS